MKKWIDKPAQWFITLIYQEHCEEQVRISESRKAVGNWVVNSAKSGTTETIIEHLAKEQRPLQLLIERFFRHAGHAVSLSGAGQESNRKLCDVSPSPPPSSCITS